jgi:hypothetical protein
MSCCLSAHQTRGVGKRRPGFSAPDEDGSLSVRILPVYSLSGRQVLKGRVCLGTTGLPLFRVPLTHLSVLLLSTRHHRGDGYSIVTSSALSCSTSFVSPQPATLFDLTVSWRLALHATLGVRYLLSKCIAGFLPESPYLARCVRERTPRRMSSLGLTYTVPAFAPSRPSLPGDAFCFSRAGSIFYLGGGGGKTYR